VFDVVLHEPEIPNNTGSIGRTCVATGCGLRLIHPLGFDISEKACRRAGLDYWPRLRVTEHGSFASYLAEASHARLWLFSAGARRSIFDATFLPGDHLLFGKESSGLSTDILTGREDRTLAVPMLTGERSLNLSNAVAIVIYEAVRQALGRGDATLDGAFRLSWSNRPGNRSVSDDDQSLSHFSS
jgi:tRNA (cytidine/uridine-2'-O-)-methyltransferase